MSSFKSILSLSSVHEASTPINSKTYNLMHSEFSLNQSTQQDGKAVGLVAGGTIILHLDHFVDQNLTKWAFGHRERKNGLLSYLDITGIAFNKIAFKDACCVACYLSYSKFGDNNIVTTLVIQANEIELNGVVHKNEWK
ncbi:MULTISPECIES: type VI secretion system tube protein TssD [Pedobacter]|uniref:Uncharacterized protein n=1 Tax=Pedobacter cryoconitis TaxID=188932 RepID=A0A127V7Y3_9SPHI|nr:type VI secretion system tube protein TssD [Pedobacter cryoconitis]AMP97414.1 hypothetical protein AY601_0458 [Pedobacter cryoconitis]